MRTIGERVRPVCPACGFIFYLNPIVAAGALVERDGKVALVRRGVEPGRGLWGLPAGYVEADESAEEAAVRETWEEAHLRIEIEGLIDAFSYGKAQDRGVLLVYAARVVAGELEAGDDAMDARWFAPDELPEIAFSTHREVLRQWRQARAVTYRPATPADAEVVAMLNEIYLQERGREYATFVNDSQRRLFVAVDNGQVVGFVGVSLLANRTARVEQVFVLPRYRRWGIGTRLIRTCVEFAVERGMRAAVVYVPVSNAGWTVYLKAGFRVSGFIGDHYLPWAEAPEQVLMLIYDL